MAAITTMHGTEVGVAQLHYARAVSELGSFTKAAAALNVSQPALSKGVAQLERALGGKLFARSSRGATATELGRVALPLVERALSSVQLLVTETRAAAGGRGAAMRMGVSPLIEPRLVARAFEAARARDSADLVISEDNLDRLNAALVARTIDVALVPAVGGAEALCRRDVTVEALVFVSGAAPDGDVPAPIELAELAVEPMLLVTDECGLTSFVRRLFAANDTELTRYPGEAHSYRNLIEWAQLGLGGALLPESKLAGHAGNRRPVVHEGRPVEIRYEAIWLRGSSRGPAIESLLDAMLDAA